ncbi:MAG TPA: methyltransferase [Candidatus Rubrimentiphilum sp.]|nr:methyltransferase [Candidatus Rubrimentiphilum sp.]
MWAASVRRRLLPPREALMEMATAIWPALALRAMVKTGLAGRLAQQPADAGELAAELQLHAASVRRLLRFLAGFDIVREGRDRRFALTRIGGQLASGNRDNAAAFIEYIGAPWQIEPWVHLDQTVRSGEPAFEQLHGMRFFDYGIAHPEAGALFDAAIGAVATLHADAVARGYNFSSRSPIADVGGGSGVVLATILERYPHASGILFDLPETIERARAQLTPFGGRIAFETGSFFKTAPRGAGAYVLSHILHDWDDEHALRILRTIRNTMSARSRVLIVESVLDAAVNRWDAGLLTDMQMMIVLGGKERTREEFRSLLSAAGMRLLRIIPTSAPESILEAEPIP